MVSLLAICGIITTVRARDTCTHSLHDAAEMNDVTVFQLQFEIKRPTDSSAAGHAGKVDRHDRLKLDVDGRFVHKDEALVQRVKVAGSSPVGAGDGTLVAATVRHQSPCMIV